MSYKTLEVELEDGRVRPCTSDILPAKAHALLTLLDSSAPVARTCGELAERWARLERLPQEEANAFADDLERARVNLPPLNTTWD